MRTGPVSKKLMMPPQSTFPASRLRRLADFVLCFGLEIAGVMALVQLALGIAGDAIDHAPALYRRALGELVGPAVDVLVFVHGEELAGAIDQAFRERAVPRPVRH